MVIKDLRYDVKSCQSVPYDHNDYIKVVRCKDCRYHTFDGWCEKTGTGWFGDEDYCSWGESKNE